MLFCPSAIILHFRCIHSMSCNELYCHVVLMNLCIQGGNKVFWIWIWNSCPWSQWGNLASDILPALLSTDVRVHAWMLSSISHQNDLLYLHRDSLCFHALVRPVEHQLNLRRCFISIKSTACCFYPTTPKTHAFSGGLLPQTSIFWPTYIW